MKRLCLVIVAGCGFSVGPSGGGAGPTTELDAPAIDAGGPTLDAPLPDASVEIDAAPMIDAAPPMWTVIETLTVSCLQQATTSTTVLTTGVTYRLRATGTCVSNNSNGSLGDAEFTFNNSVINDYSGGTDTGIAINDATPGATKQPRWGAYTTSHVYEVPWIGTGATITALVHADNYSNNSGSLTLRILALQ